MDIPAALQLQFCISTHEGSRRTGLYKQAIAPGQSVDLEYEETLWRFSLEGAAISTTQMELQLEACILQGSAREVACGLELELCDWSPEHYVLIPGSVYQGNRFYSKRFAYSPPVNGPRPGDADQTLHINELPVLSLQGPSCLELCSNDMTTPAVGVFDPHGQQAWLLRSALENELGLYGYEVEETEDRSRGRIRIMSPGMLHERIHGISGFDTPSPDRGVTLGEGERLRIRLQLHSVACSTVQGLFDGLFEHREDLLRVESQRNEIPFSEVWKILHRKHNQTNWLEQHGLYQSSISNDPTPPFNFFQTGWCGGAITTLPMIQEGDERSVGRACRNLDVLFSGQTEFGLFQEYFDGERWINIQGKSYCPEERPWTLTRRIGDALYFVTRQLMLLKTRQQQHRIRPHWESGLRRNLQAIRRIWERNGMIGQYVNLHSGEVEVSATTSGALIPAGLVVAAAYFGEPEWISLAEEIAESYREKDLAIAVCSGGPGDAMQAPDHESLAALIESLALLYDVTGREIWCQAARQAVIQLASWSFSYDVNFPPESALGEIAAQSRGAFMANVQNRCGVPGICTLSAEGVLRTFRATGEWRFLEFLRDISHVIPQFMGRRDKRIATRTSWGRKGVTHLPEGWICERVNVGRWGEEQIGEVAAYSCWVETSMMLIWNDLPGIYWDLDSDCVICLDHVEAQVVYDDEGSRILEIRNPTNFEGRVKVLAETGSGRERSLPHNAGAGYPVVTIPPQTTSRFHYSEVPGFHQLGATGNAVLTELFS